MRPVDVKKFKYKDNLASQRRRTFQIKAGLISLAGIAVAGAIGYALFYAPWFKVNNVTLKGLVGEHQDQVQQVVDESLNQKIFGIPVGKNILFFRAGSLTASLTSQFSFLGSISIQKKYFHTLNVVATERQAEGVWCFQSDCRYFDHNGVTFGQAIESSGVLLLNIDDLRVSSASTSLTVIDTKFFQAIQTVVPILTNLGVKIKNITIPLDTYTEFDILTGDGYPIKMSLDSDLQGQLNVFHIFKTQRMGDGTLHPQYIDLRYDGRVYFK